MNQQILLGRELLIRAHRSVRGDGLLVGDHQEALGFLDQSKRTFRSLLYGSNENLGPTDGNLAWQWHGIVSSLLDLHDRSFRNFPLDHTAPDYPAVYRRCVSEAVAAELLRGRDQEARKLCEWAQARDIPGQPMRQLFDFDRVRSRHGVYEARLFMERPSSSDEADSILGSRGGVRLYRAMRRTKLDYDRDTPERKTEAGMTAQVAFEMARDLARESVFRKAGQLRRWLKDLDK